MTLYGLLASLAWTAAAVLCIWRIDTLALAWLALKRSVAPQPEIVVPDDLIALAMSETEPWAQDQTLSVIRERYDTLHDWNKVRSAMGVGVMRAD